MTRCFIFLLTILLALPAYAGTTKARPEPLKFEKAVDGATIIASGRIIRLWGIKALDPSEPAAWASKLYLKTMLEKGKLSCKVPAGQGSGFHCYSDKADIGSLLVQFGLAKASNHYYDHEQSLAQSKRRGVWKTSGQPT